METDATVGLSERQQELTEFLCQHPEMSFVDVGKAMGISRTWLYEIRDRLIELGVLHPQETLSLPPDFSQVTTHPQDSMSTPYHAPVRHTWWTDDMGDWAVQGALLDRWDRKSWPDALPDEKAVAVRLWRRHGTPRGHDQRWTWQASRRTRWTSRDVRRQFLPGQLLETQIERLTLATAWALDVDALLPPSDLSDVERFIQESTPDEPSN